MHMAMVLMIVELLMKQYILGVKYMDSAESVKQFATQVAFSR